MRPVLSMPLWAMWFGCGAPPRTAAPCPQWEGIETEVLLPSRGAPIFRTRALDDALRLVTMHTWADEVRSVLLAVELHEYVDSGESHARYEDGLGAVEVEAWWTYEDDRLVAFDQWIAAYDQTISTTYSYDAAGDVIEARTTTDPPQVLPTAVTRSTWVDRRIVRQEELDDEALRLVRTWAYDLPAPALDHTERTDDGADGVADRITRRTFDLGGHLALQTDEWPATGAVVTTTNTWDDAGRPVARLIEAGASGTQLEVWAYDAGGRTVLDRLEQDNDGDGVVDLGTESTTEWECAAVR